MKTKKRTRSVWILETRTKNDSGKWGRWYIGEMYLARKEALEFLQKDEEYETRLTRYDAIR